MLPSARKIKNYVERMKGKSLGEITRTLRQTGLFYERRLVNLIREHRWISWIPCERELFNALSKHVRDNCKHIENVVAMWDQRLRTTLLSCYNIEDFRELFEKHYSSEKKLIDEVVINLEAGNINLFRSFKASLGTDIDWHSTIINKNTWPNTYFRKIHLNRAAAIGDVRATWELNRHIYWVTLGKAYFISNNAEYFGLFWHQFESWTKANPYLIGVNWLSAMEVAIRLNHWLVSYSLFSLCTKFGMKEKIRFFCWVYLHILFLNYHLTSEDRGFQNNHSIIEAASLYISSLLLSEFKESEEWLRKSKRLLDANLITQFLPDGYHEELCSSYHMQVTEAYLFSALIAERCGLTAPEGWRDSIAGMLRALSKIAKPDGNLPILGDGDDGVFLGLDVNRELPNVRTVLDIAASWIKGEQTEFHAPWVSEGAFWFCGAKSFPTREMKAFPQSRSKDEVLDAAQVGVVKGWSKSGYIYGVFSVGTRKPLRNSGHRHADLLSFNLALQGYDILADPGTFCYNGPIECRRLFQSTKSHNTITLDDQDQFDFRGSFGVTRINYESHFEAQRSAGITSFSGGYSDRDRKAWHSRDIFFLLPDFIIIRDSCGRGEYSEAMLNFTFGSDVTLRLDDEQILCEVGGSLRLGMDVYGKECGFNKGVEVGSSWVSPSYLVKKRCRSLRMRSKGRLITFTSILRLGEHCTYKRDFVGSDGCTEEYLELSGFRTKTTLAFYDHVQRQTRGSCSIKKARAIRVGDASALDYTRMIQI